MKRWLLRACACILLAGALAGCGVPGLVDDRIKIGMNLATRDVFLTSMEAAAVKAASEENVNLEVTNANNDQEAQLSQIEEWAEKGYAAAIVVLCDEKTADEVLKKAGTMPVVFLSHRPSDEVLQSRANVIYIGSRETSAGRMQGEYLANYFTSLKMESPRIAVIAGSAVNNASAERIDSAKEAMAAVGLTPTYIYETDAGWDRAAAQKNFLAFLKDKPKVDAVLAANDEMAIGAAEALSQAGYAISDIPVVGVDATAAGRAALRAGQLDFTVYQDPVAEGAGAVEAALTLLGGSRPDNLEDSIRWIEYIPITIENVDKLFPSDQ
ncbi:MAG: sugar ABC transporter substrate-binding protein [Butyricicoccus sp.]